MSVETTQMPSSREILALLTRTLPHLGEEPFPDMFKDIAENCAGKNMTAQEVFDVVRRAVLKRIGEVYTHSVDGVMLTIPQIAGTITKNPVVKNECYRLYDNWSTSPNLFDEIGTIS